MSILSDYKGRLTELLPHAEADLDDDTAFEDAVLAAIYSYSRFRPRVRAQDYDGDGSTYTFALPPDFYELSKVVDIEYSQGEQIPDWLDPVYYVIYPDLDDGVLTRKLRLHITPSSGETLRLYYTTLHVVSGSASSIPDRDFEAFCQLSASHLATTLAGHYASRFKPPLEAQLVNYRTKSDEHRSLARHFLLNFKLHMGMKEKDVSPAASVRKSLVRDSSIFRNRL